LDDCGPGGFQMRIFTIAALCAALLLAG